MQVILREEIAHLGEVGDVVTVKAGYARNFLLPRGKAVQANERQVRRFDHERRLIARKIEKMRAGAEEEKKRLETVVLLVRKAAGENGKLFGSVTTMEIDAMLREQGFEVNRRRIQLPDNIKSIGEHRVGIRLHRDVTAQIMVIVQAEASAAPVSSDVDVAVAVDDHDEE